MNIKQSKFSTWQQIKEAVKQIVSPSTEPKKTSPTPTGIVDTPQPAVAYSEETVAPKAKKTTKGTEE